MAKVLSYKSACVLFASICLVIYSCTAVSYIVDLKFPIKWNNANHCENRAMTSFLLAVFLINDNFEPSIFLPIGFASCLLVLLGSLYPLYTMQYYTLPFIFTLMIKSLYLFGILCRFLSCTLFHITPESKDLQFYSTTIILLCTFLTYTITTVMIIILCNDANSCDVPEDYESHQISSEGFQLHPLSNNLQGRDDTNENHVHSFFEPPPPYDEAVDTRPGPISVL